MKTFSPLRLALLAGMLPLLSACYYAPMTQGSYQFERHPGVVMETRWHYSYGYGYGYAYGYPYEYDTGGYMQTYVVNHSPIAKCVWTQHLPSRVLKSGDAWLISEVRSPGNVGVADIVPGDPDCLHAKKDYGMLSP